MTFAGLDETAVKVVIGVLPDDIDGTTVVSSGRPTVTISHRIVEPRRAVATTLHEAAHVRSGDMRHGPAFAEQRRQLMDARFLSALESHLNEARLTA